MSKVETSERTWLARVVLRRPLVVLASLLVGFYALLIGTNAVFYFLFRWEPDQHPLRLAVPLGLAFFWVLRSRVRQLEDEDEG